MSQITHKTEYVVLSKQPHAIIHQHTKLWARLMEEAKEQTP